MQKLKWLRTHTHSQRITRVARTHTQSRRSPDTYIITPGSQSNRQTQCFPLVNDGRLPESSWWHYEEIISISVCILFFSGAVEIGNQWITWSHQRRGAQPWRIFLPWRILIWPKLSKRLLNLRIVKKYFERLLRPPYVSLCRK